MQLLSSSREGRRHQKHRLDGGAVSAHTLTKSLAGNLYKTLLNDSAWNVRVIWIISGKLKAKADAINHLSLVSLCISMFFYSVSFPVSY